MPIYPSSSASVDDETIEYNAFDELKVKPSVATQTKQSTKKSITYSSDTTLTADVYANNITIDSGVTITTDGYNFFAVGTFTNNGTISTGTINNGGAGGAGTAGSAGGSYTSSYGGSGGGAAGAFYSGGDGGSTLVAGGAGGGYDVGGSPGSTPSAPSITTTLINTWYTNGFINYLSGAGGGGGSSQDSSFTGSVGGGGGYGLYIQATDIVAGTINTTGGAGTYVTGNGGAGGGGGGTIILTYSNSYTAGTYNTNGGGTAPYGGAEGGNGGVYTFNGSGISFASGDFSYSYTTNSASILNRNSTYTYSTLSTTSTTSTTAMSLNLTPVSSGVLKINVIVAVYNNTIGDGVTVSLYNSTTSLDTETITQEGLASNPYYVILYTEQLFTSPFTSQTYSIQYSAVTGGTAYCEIQNFTIEEVY